MDEDRESLNGGGEAQYYGDFKSQHYPPNRPLKTLDELHMIEGVTDDIYNVIAPQITIFGVKGININQADKDTLRSLHPNFITPEIADEIIKRRNTKELGGPFKNAKEFFDFIGGFGIKQEDIEKQSIPLFFGAEINFKIECLGIAGGAKNPIVKTIRAHVFDVDEVQTRLSESLVKDAQADNPQNGNPPQNPNANCSGKTGEELYACICAPKADPAEKEACLTAERNKAAAATPSQSKNRQGPPPVVFWEVD
jgi:general secretion pathway protein K